MARRADALTKIEILLLSSLARQPMSGYDLKLEMQYEHVRWWAKVEHGHLYAALQRLVKRGDIKRVAGGDGPRNRRAFAITPAGSRALRAALEAIGRAADETRFDVDVFLSGIFLLERDEALKILAERKRALLAQLAEAEELVKKMAAFVPVAGRLIMDHRTEHLAREIAFCDRAVDAIKASDMWGAFLRSESIRDFVKRTRVPLERPKS